MVEQNGKVNRTVIHSVIGVAIMFLFRYLPLSLPHVTPVGMQVLGIFIGTLYLWSTVSTLWPSIFCIFMVGLSDYTTMNGVMQTTFGSSSVVQMLFIMILMQGLAYQKITMYIGRFFLTLKFGQGKPWVFATCLMIGAMLMGGYVGPLTPIFLFWPILYGVFEDIGMKKGEAFPTILLILIGVGNLAGLCLTSFSANLLPMIGNYNNVTANMGVEAPINEAMYMVSSHLLSIALILITVLFSKFVLRPDVSKFKDLDIETLKKNPLPPLNKNQKFFAFAFACYVLIRVIPAAFPNVSFMAWLSANSTGVPIAYVALFSCLNFEKESKEAIIPFGKVMGNFSWPAFYIATTATLLGTVLTGQGTGVTDFLTTALSPIFDGVSSTAFIILVLFVTIVLTNLCNSMVVGMLMQPVILTYCIASNINPAPIVSLMMMVVLMGASLTPSASVVAALIHGNPEWLPAKSIYKYCGMFAVVCLAVTIVVGIPLVNLMIK